MIEVRRTASLEELQRSVVIAHYFGHAFEDEWVERLAKLLPLDRMLAAWDGAEVVGGGGAFPFELSVPGGRRVRAGGVTVVGVLPTHRRRGVLTAIMRAQLDDLHERGEPVAYLWASEGTIYGRFGYGIASLQGEVELARERSAFALPVETHGRMRLVERDEALETFPRVYERVLAERPGMFARAREWWELRVLRENVEGPTHNRVLLEVDGRSEGYAVYQMHQSFQSGSTTGHVQVVEAMGTDAAATRAIWRFLLDLDWVARVKADKLPVDHPLLLLASEPRRLGFRVADALWVRLVDVGAALSGRGYAGDGAIVFDVRDDFCPWNEGRWRVTAEGAGRTKDAAEIALDAAALGSAYLGGFTFRELAEAFRADELVPGAIARADGLFRTDREPWCPEIF